MTPSPESDDDIDEGYREAFSGLFGEAPDDDDDDPDSMLSEQAQSEKRGNGSPSDTEKIVILDTDEDVSSWVELEPEKDTAEITQSLSESRRIAAIAKVHEAEAERASEAAAAAPPPETPAPSPPEERAPTVARTPEPKARPKPPVNPDDVDESIPALPPAGAIPGEGAAAAPEPDFGSDPDPSTRTAIFENEEFLGHHGGEETTRAMSTSVVDDVLRDMERRVHESHASSPHDTVEDLVIEPVKRPPPREESPPASTAALLDTWIRKNASPAATHFERLGALDAPRRPIRPGAALEIGATELRYLSLQPYESGRQVVRRYETIALAPATGDGPEERMGRIAAGLAALRERLGTELAPCSVLHDQGAVGARVLTLAPNERFVGSAVRKAIEEPGEPPLLAHRVMGQIRAAEDGLKAVLVSTAPSEEISRLRQVLREAATPTARIASAQVAFLETVVPKAARIDEDAAEVFLLIEARSITFALAARAVPLLARVVRLERDPGTPEWVEEILEQMRQASPILERACGSGELARIRYLMALPPKIDFPAAEIVVAFGRPAENIELDVIFRVDLESAEKASVPRDALGLLCAAAYETTLGNGPWIDLAASPRQGLAVAAVWALVAAAAVALGLALGSWQPGVAELDMLERQAQERQRSVLSLSSVDADFEQANELAWRRTAVEADLALEAAVEARAPDLAAIVSGIAPLVGEDAFYERLHAARAEKARARWALELTAVAVREPGKAEGGAGELLERLKKSSLTLVTARPAPAETPDESPLSIGATAGGDK